MIRTRPGELGVTLAVALVLGGCGGGAERRTGPQPKLQRAVASQLAERSDQVAAALDEGDPCRALAEAQRLQQDTIQAINDSRVPGPFQEHLGAAVNDLVARIECVPPANDEERDKPGKRKGKKKHNEGDE